MPEGKSVAAKVLIVSAIVTGVGFGLCSFGAVGTARWSDFAVRWGLRCFLWGLRCWWLRGW